ncbi:hypothetical protein AAF712_014186 [Marasmius tenuissimus]|uniref:NAD(P)-binding protein n=1 Tax=Marasmius tenuissimus TaxID=585030 RepID=A0ABR2ZBQ8_9AGAR
MPSLAHIKASNASFTLPSTTPVAVLVGGSGGIGAAVAEALARYANGNVHIIIVARNEEASRKVLQTCVGPLSSESSTPVIREFVECDYSLVESTRSAVQAVAGLLKDRASTGIIDYLVFSSNFVSLENKRNDTEEGHDYQLRVRYYHRFQMTCALAGLGLLGDGSRVLTILGAGKKGVKVEVKGEDFEFRESEVGSGKLGAVVSTVYTDIGFKVSRFFLVSSFRMLTSYGVKEFATRNPTIGVTHMHPGFVRTGLITNILDGIRKKAIVGPLLYFLANAVVAGVTIQPEESAEYMIYALFNGKGGDGTFYRRDRVGDDIKEVVNHEGVDPEKLYEHSLKVTEVA